MKGQRRAPVQAERSPEPKPAGTIAWEEHVLAWESYANKFGTYQSAERIAERGGFGHTELLEYLGHEPVSFKPR